MILTSSRQDYDLIDEYEFGANSYVCKPIDFDEFAAAVAQLGEYWPMIKRNGAVSRGRSPSGRTRLRKPATGRNA